MINFFKKKTNNNNDDDDVITKTASLLIHAAKIDENYTNKEKLIIQKTILELGANKEKINQIMKSAEESEQNSNQILDYTKYIKNKDEIFKKKNNRILVENNLFR